MKLLIKDFKIIMLAELPCVLWLSVQNGVTQTIAKKACNINNNLCTYFLHIYVPLKIQLKSKITKK